MVSSRKLNKIGAGFACNIERTTPLTSGSNPDNTFKKLCRSFFMLKNLQ